MCLHVWIILRHSKREDKWDWITSLCLTTGTICSFVQIFPTLVSSELSMYLHFSSAQKAPFNFVFNSFFHPLLSQSVFSLTSPPFLFVLNERWSCEASSIKQNCILFVKIWHSFLPYKSMNIFEESAAAVSLTISVFTKSFSAWWKPINS